jgi:hypothetical protein
MEQPFDNWLHKQLHEMYDAVAKEPLPDDLMKLIDDDAVRSAESGLIANDGHSPEGDGAAPTADRPTRKS